MSTCGNQDKGPHLPPPRKQNLLFCPKSKLHIHRGEISKIMQEHQEESFRKRGLFAGHCLSVPSFDDDIC
uniref:Uncharacterized protein n=1 Tax=Prolemur simus TaxID=1328070 RepID=A0A8C9DK37_PROSS